MSLQSLRLRRALTSLASFHRSLSTPTPIQTPTPRPSLQSSNCQWISSLFQTRSFRGTEALLERKREYKLYKEGDEITEDTVLFEGCDFNHWLITVDFPKDPAPTPEEMVATYERICAQGLNISIEEAKKKIYACSTTTYQGFQAIMTEEESEKFQEVPGVVFVLPDSYIDPQNKQYGGDLYENGVITPRPPPIQYRRDGGKFRNRNYDQQRYNQQGGPMPNHGNPQHNQQGPPQQNYQPQQNYPPRQNYPLQQSHGPPQNYPRQQGYGSQQNYPQQQGYGSQQNYPQQQNYGPSGGPYQTNQHPQGPRSFPQGDQRDFGRDNRNISSNHAGTYGQGTNESYGQSSDRGQHVNYPPAGQTGTNQGRY